MDINLILIMIPAMLFIVFLLLYIRQKQDNRKKSAAFSEILNNNVQATNGTLSMDSVHEIKNSLDLINTFSQVLKRRLNENPECQDYLFQIQNSCEKIVFLLDNTFNPPAAPEEGDQTFIHPLPELPGIDIIIIQLGKLKKQQLSGLAWAVKTLDVEMSRQIIAEIAECNHEAAALFNLLVKDYRFDLLTAALELRKND